MGSTKALKNSRAKLENSGLCRATNFSRSTSELMQLRFKCPWPIIVNLFPAFARRGIYLIAFVQSTVGPVLQVEKSAQDLGQNEPEDPIGWCRASRSSLCEMETMAGRYGIQIRYTQGPNRIEASEELHSKISHVKFLFEAIHNATIRD